MICCEFVLTAIIVGLFILKYEVSKNTKILRITHAIN